MIFNYIYYLAILILFALMNFYRDREKLIIRYPELAKKQQRKWKHYQFLLWALIFTKEFLYLYGLNFTAVIKLLGFSLFWNVTYDGLLNLFWKRNFFDVSIFTQSRIEKTINKILNGLRIKPILLKLLMIVIGIILIIL